MIVPPRNGGYWIDGTDHNDCSTDREGNPVLPQSTSKHKLEMDDTAKCYRRHFLGKVGKYKLKYENEYIVIKYKYEYKIQTLPNQTSRIIHGFNPLALRASKTGLTILLIFSSQKCFHQKDLKEKCLSEYYQQLSFKYFVRICFISKLFSKVRK